MSSQPERFALAVLSAFERAGLLTDQEIGAAGGPSTTTLTKLRKTANGLQEPLPELRGDTMRRIDRAAKWPPGSARTLWREGVQPPSESERWKAAKTRTGPRGPMKPEVAAMLLEIAEFNAGQLQREAEADAAEIAPNDPELAAAIIQDAASIANDLLRSVGRVIRGEREPPLSEPADRPELSIAADERAQPIEQGQGHDENP